MPAYTTLVVIRSDGESFVDAVMDTDGQSVCRLIVGGNEEDGWTIYTQDGKPSAQWEIQIAVTEDGYEILAY